MSGPDNPKLTMELTFGNEVVTVEVEFRFSDNAEDFFDVQHFVTAATAALME